MNLSLNTEILKFWFNTENKMKLWLSKRKIDKSHNDSYITKFYGKYLNEIEQMDVRDIIDIIKKNSQLIVTDSFGKIITSISPEHREIYFYKQLVSVILVLDQFSRHVYRNTNSDLIRDNTIKALFISEYLCKKKAIYNLPLSYRIFVLMPMKHMNIIAYFDLIKRIVQQSIDLSKTNFDTMNENYMYRFYQDSLKKYLLSLPGPNKAFSANGNNYTDNCYTENDFKKVCEYYSNCPLFIRDVDIFSQIKSNILLRNCCEFIESNLEMIKNGELVVSLSGGPDSMVLTYILSKLESRYGYNLSAFHLNYNNRVESLFEEQMIVQYCRNINVPLYIHRITHLKRSNSKREYYEDVTREIRFKMYKRLGSNIVLGHIMDDLIENIWTNFMNGKELFNLSKILPISTIDGVNILRPLCRVNKKDILKFAHDYKISYLCDTTPKWSNRWKLRNKLLPLLKSEFEIDTEKKILFLSDSLSSYKSLLDKKVFDPIFNSVVMIDDNSLELNIGEYDDQGLHFWQHILTELFHKLGSGMPSLKSIQNFVNLMHIFKNSNYSEDKLYIKLKKNVETYITNKKNLHIKIVN